jgi:acid stress chaperone HdeB
VENYNETMAHHVRYGVGVDRAASSASAVTIDITKITCYQFLDGQLTDSRTLGIWLNGYANGARGKTLIDPLSVTENNLIDYCVSHNNMLNMLVLDAARNVVGADK